MRLAVRSAVACLAVCTAISRSGVATVANAQVNGASDVSCSLRRVAETPLRDAERHPLYIEPNTAVAGPRGIFLAGAPTFRWTGPEMTVGAIFGVVVRPDGSVRNVPWPLASHSNLADMRATLLADGSWGVVFAELGLGDLIPRRATLLHLWFGRFDGRAWHDLEMLPVPPGARLLTEDLSPLASRGDGLAVSAPIVHGNAPPGAIVFSRDHGRWSVSELGVNGVAYSRPAPAPDSGWDALVIRGDASGTNVPYVYERDGAEGRYTWRSLGSFVAERNSIAQQPTLFATGDRLVMSWLRTRPHHTGDGSGGAELVSGAWIGRGKSTRRSPEQPAADLSELVPTRVLSSHVTGYAGTLRPSGTAFYAVQSDTAVARRAGDVRLLRVRGRSVEDLGTVPTPYADVFTLVAPSDTDVVLFGPHADVDARGAAHVVTDRIQLRVRCDRN